MVLTLAAVAVLGYVVHAGNEPAGAPPVSAGPTGLAPTSPHSASTSTLPAPSGSALAALARLPVRGRAPLTGYSRTRFGPAWADVDRNGCDTRNDILRRDLGRTTVKPGTHGCKILSGVLIDPYTGARMTFTRGVGTSSRAQIDHVVALADAWQTGAQRWPAAERERFANDPLDLLAVDGTQNQRKGAGDAATWLPPNKSFRCSYVARQVAVKIKYQLWVTAAEQTAIRRVLSRCPGTALPGG